MSFNHVFLVGRLGAAPEQRTTAQGKLVCRLRVATDHYDKAQGAKVADWHSVVVWEREAENCVRYLSTGSQVAIEGRIQHRQYEKAGEKRYFTEVVAHRVMFLGSKRDTAGGGLGAPEPERGRAIHDDLPF